MTIQRPHRRRIETGQLSAVAGNRTPAVRAARDGAGRGEGGRGEGGRGGGGRGEGGRGGLGGDGVAGRPGRR